MVLLLALSTQAHAATAIKFAHVFHDGELHGQTESSDPSVRVVSWPFCPTFEVSCSDYAWVELGISVDAYVARRNAPHEKASEILDTSAADLVPLSDALTEFFLAQGITSEAVQAGYVHGLVKSVHYSFDSDTGWTEYPKYAIEYFVDEQGDCDDSAIAVASLMRNLGMPGYIVRWRSTTGDTGHLSTAIEPTWGDLSRVSIPSGSQWVSDMQGGKLLGMDAAGTIGGCNKGCRKLGTNKWHSENLVETVVVSITAADLDEQLPMRAWNNVTPNAPTRTRKDRRGMNEDLIRKELEEIDWDKRTHERLKRLGEEDPHQYIAQRRVDPVGDTTWWILSSAMAVVLAGAAVVGWRGRQKRLARIEELRREREKQRF
jgi:hypothetical protein